MLILIAALGKNGEIGKKNRLLWDLPADMQHFRQTTAGKPVIMGRTTYESIGRLLPNRKNIILSKNPEYRILGADVVCCFESAVHLAQNCHEDVFVIGGKKIYEIALPHATHMILTHVEGVFPDADTYFPEFDLREWQIISEEYHAKDDENPFAFRIVHYERI